MNRNESELSRRTVLQGAAAAASLAGLPNWFVRQSVDAEMEAESAGQRKIGPNDTIQMAVIGPGGPRGGFRQGLGDSKWLASKKGVKFIAACDVDDEHARNAAKELNLTKTTRDYREILQMEDVDAVVIGTPDHWHAQIAIDAMNAGKDVYCEKPMTLFIAQGRAVSDTARRRRRVFQTGSQQRSDGRFRLAVLVTRSGRLGKIKKIQTRLPTGPVGGPFEVKPVPSDFDFQRWLGPAPEAEYCPERTHGSFRWWLDYSGGMMTDWGAHHNDIAQWALDMDNSGPVSLWSTGKPQPAVGPMNYTTFTDFDIHHTYANGTELHCTNQGENGVHIEGENGWVFVSRGRIEASDPALLQDPLPPGNVIVSNDHAQNFVDCIRSRALPICNAEVGHRSVTVCHLGNISLRLGGRKLQWDPVKERIVGDDEANAYVNRPVRKIKW